MDQCGKDYVNLIKSLIKKQISRKVLDVGCGSGGLTVLLKKGNQVFGTDVADWRNKKYKNDFSFFLSPKDRINYEDNSFDVVTNFDVIEHVEDDSVFVKELFRVVRPGGHILTVTPNRYRLSNVLRMLLSLKKLEYPMKMGEDAFGDCIHIREYTMKDIKKLFSDVGFKSIKVYPFWFGLRKQRIDKFRIIRNVPFPLNLMSQYVVVEALK